MLKSISSPNDTIVTLKDPSCMTSSNATHYKLLTSFNACGTTSKQVGDYIVIANEVIIYNGVDRGITRGTKTVIPFSCKYKRSDLESSLKAFQTKINSTIHAREGKCACGLFF